MTGWTDEARRASAEARRRRAAGRAPAPKKRRKGMATVTSITDRIKKQGQDRRSFADRFTEAARAGRLQNNTPFGNYADYLNRWSHMRANAQGTLSDEYWRRKGVDPVAARASAAAKRRKRSR